MPRGDVVGGVGRTVEVVAGVECRTAEDVLVRRGVNPGGVRGSVGRAAVHEARQASGRGGIPEA